MAEELGCKQKAWGDTLGTFHGAPCENSELWVTWRLGTLGPKVQGGVEAQEVSGMAKDGMGQPTKGRTAAGCQRLLWHLICVYLSCVPTCGCPTAAQSPEASLNHKSLDPCGFNSLSYRSREQKKTDKNSFSVSVSSSFSMSHPSIMEENEAEGCRGQWQRSQTWSGLTALQ